MGMNYTTLVLPVCALWLAHLFVNYVLRRKSKRKTVEVAVSVSEKDLVAGILFRKCSDFPVLGFDCEWVSEGRERHPVALLQLASSDGFCALIRLRIDNTCFQYIPLLLRDILADESILKVGVAPIDDAVKLRNDYGILVRGCLDLRHLVVRKRGLPLRHGLSGLAKTFLNIDMLKPFFIQCGDWEAVDLTPQQISYAADDAWIAIRIFKVLTSPTMNECNNNVLTFLGAYWHHSVWGSYLPPIRGYADCKFYIQGELTRICLKPTSESFTGCKPFKPPKVLPRAFGTRQTPLYHNCLMMAPDGAVLCTCDYKKAMWYVYKGLADVIEDYPLTVRLLFEPSGRAVGSVGQYYVQPKENCCVVCGRVDSCIRKNVVPHEYRKYFPKIMKDHSSHDVLLLCLPCHLHSNRNDLKMKRRLAEICGAQFCQGDNAKYTLNREANAAKAAAKALLRSATKIPEDRCQQLRETVKKYFKVNKLSIKILETAAALNAQAPNDNYDPHGKKIVQYFSKEGNGGLTNLEEIWRMHFLDCMSPKYMPTLWSVTHTRDRLAIRASENRILPNELRVAGLKRYIPRLGSTEQKYYC